MHQSINQSINQPTNQSTNQSINQSVKQRLSMCLCACVNAFSRFRRNYIYPDLKQSVGCYINITRIRKQYNAMLQTHAISRLPLDDQRERRLYYSKPTSLNQTAQQQKQKQQKLKNFV